MKHLDVAVAIVFRDSRVLITRRKSGAVLGGYWEFPGGKLERGETLHDCVRREVEEELGILVQPVISFTPVQYQYADRHVTLHAFLCTHESGEPKPLASDELRWVTCTELQTLPFPPANQQLIEQVIAALPATKMAPNGTLPNGTLPNGTLPNVTLPNVTSPNVTLPKLKKKPHQPVVA